MNLLEELTTRHSKKHMQFLADQICRDSELYAELIRAMIYGEPPVPRYAAWLLQHCSDQQPELIIPHIGDLLALITTPVHDGVKRGVIRSLVPIDIPEKHIGQTADLCFKFLEDAKEPVAVKMFSMCVLWNICQKIPELTEELAMQIEIQMPIGSAGFKSRGRKILKAIRG